MERLIKLGPGDEIGNNKIVHVVVYENEEGDTNYLFVTKDKEKGVFRLTKGSSSGFLSQLKYYHVSIKSALTRISQILAIEMGVD